VAVDSGAELAALFGLVVAGILGSAKFHGRQVRMRREAEGHMHVHFRRQNHPWVEEMWREDRLGFWWTFGVLASLSAATAGWHALSGRDLVGLDPAVSAILLLGWAFPATFIVMGVWWSIDLARSTHTTPLVSWLQSLAWLAVPAACAVGQWLLLA
jgi:hypothetical protein